MKREHVGSASMGVGALLFALGIIFITSTTLGITPNQSWIVPWITNYVASGVGVLVGLVLIGYGVYMRGLLGRYARRVETLAEARAEQAQKLRQKTIALKKAEEEAGRKETALQLTKAELRASRELTERRTGQMYSVRGKLGERSKRLKRIAEIAKTKKKK